MNPELQSAHIVEMPVKSVLGTKLRSIELYNVEASNYFSWIANLQLGISFYKQFTPSKER